MANGPTASPGPGEYVTDIEIVGPVVPDPARRLAEPVATALDDAMRLTRDHPSDFGLPRADPLSGGIVLTVANAEGASLAKKWVPSGPPGPFRRDPALQAQAASVPRKSLATAHSFAALEAIKEDVFYKGRAVEPVLATIWAAEDDPDNNRIILTAAAASEDLFRVLAARYGTKAVAVRIQSRPENLAVLGRQSDVSPFFGGSRVKNTSTGQECSDAFGWVMGTTQFMLTAGHCAPTGGSFSTPSQSMGAVTHTSHENWDSSNGTVQLPGQSEYRGDLALITLSAGRAAGGYIYRYENTSSTASPVREMWWRRSLRDDQFCTGAATTGEKCGWSVVGTNAWVDYGYGKVAKNVTSAVRYNDYMLQGGDSGGSVFTVRTDGGIAAKGIIHGAAGGWFGSCSGAYPCTMWFTEIWDVYDGFPGSSLKTQ